MPKKFPLASLAGWFRFGGLAGEPKAEIHRVSLSFYVLQGRLPSQCAWRARSLTSARKGLCQNTRYFLYIWCRLCRSSQREVHRDLCTSLARQHLSQNVPYLPYVFCVFCRSSRQEVHICCVSWAGEPGRAHRTVRFSLVSYCNEGQPCRDWVTLSVQALDRPNMAFETEQNEILRKTLYNLAARVRSCARAVEFVSCSLEAQTSFKW